MHHYWLKARTMGRAGDFADYSINTAAALENKFVRAQPQMSDSPLSQIAHAFQFDATLFGRFLSAYAQERGVRRREGRIVDVTLKADNGFIESVTMADGETIAADLFIDCSGFRALLIGQALKVGFEDWSHWLPCDRAVAIPCERSDNFTPYTRSSAHEAGWQWRIPLQHRTGNGYVFCESHLSEDKAMDLILQRLDGKPQGQPRVIRFTTGHRKKQWNRNVIAMGLASGFLEPLESTSIYLVQEAIMKLIRFFPRDRITDSLRNSFNAEMLFAYDDVKDFLIAHYKVTEREDTPFWAYCKHMDIPDSLKARLESFAQHNLSLVKPNELFKEASWFAVLVGQGLMPKSYHPVADLMPEDEFRWRMDRVREGTAGLANSMPGHEAYIARACPSTQLGSI
jgi:tryptophan halogenase